MHRLDERNKTAKEEDKLNYILLECLDSKFVDGALTKLNIDNGKHFLEIKSEKKNQAMLKN